MGRIRQKKLAPVGNPRYDNSAVGRRIDFSPVWPTFRERFRHNPVRTVFWYAVSLYVVAIIVTGIWSLFDHTTTILVE
jgi:hypothetical protein